jgi:hypothetical protein
LLFDVLNIAFYNINLYILENFNLNGGEIRKLKSSEGNALKRMIGIPTRCKSTDLFLSFDIIYQLKND